MSIEEDMKNIKEYITNWVDSATDEDGYNTGTLDEESQKFIQAIENVLKEVERLTNARDWYFKNTTAQIATPEQLHKILSFDYVSKDKIRKTFQNKRNEIFSNTYLSKEQYKPYEMSVEIINQLEKELLESEG